MGDVSEACLLDYIYCSGGKVTNTDLLKTYKPYISHSDLHLRAKYREEFKRIIDTIAVCKSENGEKYLVLKKKYKQLMQERESKSGAEAEAEAGRQCDLTELRSWAPARQPSPTSMDVEQSRKPALVAWCEAPAITVSEAQVEEPIEDVRAERQLTEPADTEEELDKVSESKSESEQEEECTGSVGSAVVALDPIEKEWMYSAACGRLPHLTQLLKQDASLANKKECVSITALHWAAKHGKQDMAVAMADAGADVNTKAHQDSEKSNCTELPGNYHAVVRVCCCNLSSFVSSRLCCLSLFSHLPLAPTLARVCACSDGFVAWDAQGGYTPLHIAALHGHRHIIDLLITTYGAKENLRDYSGHLASHYLNIQKTVEEPSDLISEYHSPAQVSERRNRKLSSLFHSRKKWGSAEELAPVPEERTAPQQLTIPAFRPRKFSR
ncbi:uncharacterized protein LOC113576313 [Electrophorus electricus]|uniref:uncharacterized protein LOC113576313 n=1 Tax=Electrophorus electricus TaxID=8005 RepID=UPI0015D0B370|nr:uncharacterized protein LOC113576313 [Electrophorus electricus]